MADALEILIGSLTLGLPLWFAALDRRAAPHLTWKEAGKGIPAWGHMIVVVGVVLAVLIAFAVPISDFHPSH